MNTNALYRHWRVYAASHNLTQVTLHEIRHTFVSMAKAEIPAELLKQVVGHSASMDTFGIYGHQTEKDMQTTATGIDALFEKITKT